MFGKSIANLLKTNQIVDTGRTKSFTRQERDFGSLFVLSVIVSYMADMSGMGN